MASSSIYPEEQLQEQRPNPNNRSCPSRIEIDFCCVSFLILFAVLIPLIVLVIVESCAKPPTFGICDFSVANLTVSSRLELTANWEASLTVVNPSRLTTFKFVKVHGFVYYKNASNRLSQVTRIKSFTVKDKGGVAVINVEMRSEQPDNDVAEEIRMKLKEYGTLSFGLQLTMMQHSSLGMRTELPGVICENLKVDFDGGSSSSSRSGKLVEPKECFLDESVFF